MAFGRVHSREVKPLLLVLQLPVWVGHSCPTPLTLGLGLGLPLLLVLQLPVWSDTLVRCL